MNFLKMIFRQSWRVLMEYLTLTFIALGFLFLIIYYGFPDWTPMIGAYNIGYVRDVFGAAGKSFLAGGVFTSIVKSNQFLQIFKEQLFDIIYGEKFLKTREDIDQVMARVTSVYCGERFPKISEQINQELFDKYFVNNFDFYYEMYYSEINVSINKHGFLTLTEYVEIDLIPEEQDKEIEFQFSSSIDLVDKTDQYSSYRMDSLSVDGEELWDKRKNSFFPGKGKYIHNQDKSDKISLDNYFNVPLCSKPVYQIKRKTVKTYSIKSNPIKIYQANTFYQKMELHITSTESVMVDFYKLGTLDDFVVKGIDRNGSKKRESKSFVLPNQGFTLIFKTL